MIEQLGMRRQFASDAKVIRGAHDASAVNPVPDAIDHDPRSQRIAWGSQPLGQLQAAALIDWNGCRIGLADHLNESPWNCSTEVADAAADMHASIFRSSVICHRHGFG